MFIFAKWKLKSASKIWHFLGTKIQKEHSAFHITVEYLSYSNCISKYRWILTSSIRFENFIDSNSKTVASKERPTKQKIYFCCIVFFLKIFGIIRQTYVATFINNLCLKEKNAKDFKVLQRKRIIGQTQTRQIHDLSSSRLKYKP